MRRIITLLSVIMVFSLMVGCSHIENVPPGYIGKILTPTGWKQGLLEAGQVDLGKADSEGRYSIVVLLEVTSVTIKEQFLSSDASEDKQDHRVFTKERVPLAVDIYSQIMVPEEEELRNAIFVQVTPTEQSERVKKITLQNVYDRFAKMSIRGKTRAIFAKYKDDRDVLSNYEKVNAEIVTMIVTTFKENGAPLKLASAQLSNVKVDATVWEAESKNASAEAEVAAINKVGEAIRANPGYLQFMKWKTLGAMAEKGPQNGMNTIIITDSKENVGITLPSSKK